MMCLLHYYSASKRLKESEKTIYMLGGKNECNEMILAQNEMIKLEKEYYREESIVTLSVLGAVCFVALLGLTFYFRIYNV